MIFPDVAKALWLIFMIFLPYLGVFIYLIARGGKMHEHAVADAQSQDAAFRSYVQDAAGAAGAPPTSCPSWPICATRA